MPLCSLEAQPRMVIGQDQIQTKEARSLAGKVLTPAEPHVQMSHAAYHYMNSSALKCILEQLSLTNTGTKG